MSVRDGLSVAAVLVEVVVVLVFGCTVVAGMLLLGLGVLVLSSW